MGMVLEEVVDKVTTAPCTFYVITRLLSSGMYCVIPGCSDLIVLLCGKARPDSKLLPRVKVVDSRTADRAKIADRSLSSSGVSTVVVEVMPGSNAEAAGVKAGDKIRSLIPPIL